MVTWKELMGGEPLNGLKSITLTVPCTGVVAEDGICHCMLQPVAETSAEDLKEIFTSLVEFVLLVARPASFVKINS